MISPILRSILVRFGSKSRISDVTAQGAPREMNKDHQYAAYGSPSGRTTSAPSIRDEAPIRQAARLVIDEMGANAGRYAALRARVLERQGDAAGASAWRRVAPVIQELQRQRKMGKARQEKDDNPNSAS